MALLVTALGIIIKGCFVNATEGCFVKVAVDGFVKTTTGCLVKACKVIFAVGTILGAIVSGTLVADLIILVEITFMIVLTLVIN